MSLAPRQSVSTGMLSRRRQPCYTPQQTSRSLAPATTQRLNAVEDYRWWAITQVGERRPMQKTQAPNERPGGVMASRLGRQTRRRGQVWLVPPTPQANTTPVASQSAQIVGALALDEAPACDSALIPTPAPACVLIVEDDPHVAALLRNAFELEGRPEWSIDILPEGRAALAHAQQAAPSVVLLDVRLPDMDGAEVFRRLRETPGAEACQIVFLTAASSLDLSVRGVDGGVLVRKPFDVRQVIALVTDLLREP